MSTDFAKLKARCEAAGQSQLLHFWDKLAPSEQHVLTTQIEATNLDRVNAIYARAIQAEKDLQNSTNEDIHPLPSSAFDSIIDSDPAKENEWRRVGMQAISKGEVGVLLMAGGQGTRLGSSRPKGCYDIGLPSHKSLFEIQAERIGRLQEVAAASGGGNKGRITWYVMTSGPTRAETVEFFKEKGFFGLGEGNVIFFEQGTLPCLTMEGKIILDAPSKIAVAPDGNGGVYAALRSPISGSSHGGHTVLEDMQKRGVRYIHAYGVDNCLVRVADPVFIGCGIVKKADCAVKVVRKTVPTESVGVVAMRGDKYSVVEYSEISKEQAERRSSEDGELAFRAANIVNHFYTTAFLQSVQTFEDELAFHIARKKIPHVDPSSGELVKPSSPNGMKLELFVFDVFPFAKQFEVMEVERKEEFSPLKNAPGTGVDDPQTSRRDILEQQKRFLQKAGASVGDGVEIELSPSVTYAGEGLESVKGKKFVKSGIVATLKDFEALQ